MRTLIRNGTVISASDSYGADVLVEGEQIAAVGALADEIPADVTIDAEGMYVLPGGIDVHTHLDMPFGGTTSCDDFESGTVAAACGGTTTIVDFAIQARGQRLHDALDAWRAKAEGRAAIDYGFHVAITDFNDFVEHEMDELLREGVNSFKVFMAYKGSLMLDDAGIFRLLQRSRENGALIMVHAENGDVIDVEVRRARAAGQLSPKYHALTRPPAVEAEATRRAIALAEMARAHRIYVVHLSAAGALDAVVDGRRRGVQVIAETCPQYLFLSDEKYDEPGFEGAKYVMSPPLRPKETQARLWQALEQGDLQVVATDHCPFRMKDQKILGEDDFSKIPNGAPGIENRMSLMYEGVRTGALSLFRFVDVTSTRPAQIFGLWPRKGAIRPGSDADIVLFDTEKPTTISAKTHHMKVDYNPYEGRVVHGVAHTVMQRGRVIVDHGRFVGARGCGSFLGRF